MRNDQFLIPRLDADTFFGVAIEAERERGKLGEAEVELDLNAIRRFDLQVRLRVPIRHDERAAGSRDESRHF